MKLKLLATFALVASLSLSAPGIAFASTPIDVLSSSDAIAAVEGVTGPQVDADLMTGDVSVKTVETSNHVTVAATDTTPGYAKEHVDIDVMYAGSESAKLSDSSSGPELAVDAYIVNDFLGAPFGALNDQYEAQAKAEWSLFAYRLDLN